MGPPTQDVQQDCSARYQYRSGRRRRELGESRAGGGAIEGLDGRQEEGPQCRERGDGGGAEKQQGRRGKQNP